MEKQTVVVLGASPKPDRYSHKAVQQLLENGHRVYPIHPTCDAILGQPCYKKLIDIQDKIDTLSVYVNADKLTQLLNDILRLKPGRIIFNPGTENEVVENAVKEQGIEVIQGCTLVMLRTGQF